MRVAVGTDDRLHRITEYRTAHGTSKSHRSFRFRDADAGDHAILAVVQQLVSRRDWPHPFHCELLQRQQQVAEISTIDLHVVRRERQAQRFCSVVVMERSGYEVLIWEEVCFAS